MSAYRQAIKVQQWLVITGILLLGIKFYAWFSTGSIAILTDALEGIVNVLAGGVTLYSLIVANKPRDTTHPYGHGKAEFISAGIEGSLITVAGIIIYYKAITSFFTPQPIKKLDIGLLLIAIAGLINFGAGWYAVQVGKKTKSLGITASGKHLISDGYSSFGLVGGLILILITGWEWLDGVIAILFGTLIIVTGLKIIKESIAGIMGSVDKAIISQLVLLLETKRRENWIDLHNLRVIKYGNVLHVDCHLTLPWFLNLREAHKEVDALTQEIRQVFGDSVEILVHTDACLPASCRICQKTDCKVRQSPFRKKIVWNLENLFENEKHAYPN